MKPRTPRMLILLAPLVGGLPVTGAPTPAPDTLLDGTEKSLVVVGYSTSYAWPQMLQDMLDQHSGGKRTYHVLNAVIGGSPVETWIADRGSDDYKKTIGAMVRDYIGEDARLRKDAPSPTVALCQQSLQFTRTQRGPVTSKDDAEGIRIGANAFARLAFRLRDLGLDQVYIAGHIYKEPIEPEVGNERIALAAMLDRGNDFVLAGPDVWTLTREAHPAAFAEDGLHPNDRGMKIMAEAWYRTVAGSKAKQSVVDAMLAHSYDVDTMMRQYVQSRRPGDDADAPQREARRDRARRGRGGRRGNDDAPKVGDMAPDFELKMLDDKTKSVQLASLRDKRPAILFFGSYT